MPTGRYVWSDGRGMDPENNHAWIMRYDDGEIGDEGKPEYQFADPEANGFADLLTDAGSFGSTHCTSIDDLRDVTGAQTNSGGDNYQGTGVGPQPQYQDGCLKVDADDRDDGCAVRVNFNPISGRLEKINFVCYTGDRSGEDEGQVSFDVFVFLREPCINIAQTEKQPYESVGWTDRLWQGSRYIIDNLPGNNHLRYKFDLPGSPFGSLALSNLSQTDPLINIYSHYSNSSFDVFDSPPAIVGSPYSCGINKNCLDTNYFNVDTEKYVLIPGRSGAASQKSITFGKSRLVEIFAKISSVWSWLAGGSGVSYKENIITTPIADLEDEDVNPYNLTGYSTNDTKAPKVYPLGNCKTGEKCLEGNIPGMTVNGKSNGNVVFPTDVAKVNLKFYGYADKDQMPIRKIKVNWGDGIIVDLDGYFRNQRGLLNGECKTEDPSIPKTCYVNNLGINDFDTKTRCAVPSDCAYIDSCFPENTAPNFGQIANKTCDNTYFKFDHVYQCVRGGEGWKDGREGGPDCSNQQMKALYGGCCEFIPAVQLKDNWGWCNGSCPDPAGLPAGGPGCYEKDWGNQATFNKECSVINDSVVTPWTKFDNGVGKIIVAPN